MRKALTAIDVALAKIESGVCADDLEGPTLDFKEQKSSVGDTEKQIAEAAICFANSAGGTIVLGVKDKVRGKDAFIGTTIEPNQLKQRIYQLSVPPLNVEVERHHKYENILLVNVPQSASIHADTQGRACRRINKSCQPMSPDEQSRLREERQGIDWSAQPSGIMPNELDASAILLAKKTLANFPDTRRSLARLGDLDMLTALGAIAPNGEVNRAGQLMFGGDDPSVTTQIVYQFRATPGGEPKFVQRLSPPLLNSFTKVIDYVSARQGGTLVNLPGGQQITIDDFPSLAVREAISNAVCHRDYHLNGPTTIEQSPEVFIVTSPGPLVSGVTPENIITTTSRPRNPTISKIARILGLAEELGRGIDRMYREMIRSGRDIPRIEAEYDFVKVTLVGGAPNTQIARFVATLPVDEKDDTDTMLVLYKLCNSKTVSVTSVSKWLQKTPQETQAVLRRLSGDSVGLLEVTRGTVGRAHPTYRLRELPLKMLGSAVVYQRRTTDEIDRKVIEHVREYGKITNRTLQNFLEVHVFKARDIISDLNQRGILVRVSDQTRGPKVEWGPGVKFPRKKEKKKITEDYEDRQITLNFNDE